MKLKRMLLRYYPPGIILEYITSNNTLKSKICNLPQYTHNTYTEQHIDTLIKEIIVENNLEIVGIDHKRYDQLYALTNKLITRYQYDHKQLQQQYTLQYTIQSHSMQIANIQCDKHCNVIATVSYDRTCKINVYDKNIDQYTGLHTLSGHNNVVYCVALNNNSYTDIAYNSDTPLNEQLLCATGSFDTTCKVYNVHTGTMLYNLTNHNKEIICLLFSPDNIYLATGSVDCTVCVYNILTGNLVYQLHDHTAEIVTVQFNTTSTQIATASFDSTICVYDLTTGSLLHALCGHTAEVTAIQYTYNSELLVSSSIDGTVRIWDVASGDCIHVIRTHTTDILYCNVSTAGDKIVSCDAYGIVCIHGIDGTVLHHIVAHNTEINYVTFNTSANRLVTCCNDGTSKVYNSDTGQLLQTLGIQNQAMLSAQFSYDGNSVVLFCKNNNILKYNIAT